MTDLKEKFAELRSRKKEVDEQKQTILRTIALELLSNFNLTTPDETTSAVALFERSSNNVISYFTDKQLESAIYSVYPNLNDKQRKEAMKYLKLEVYEKYSMNFSHVQPVAFADELDVPTWNRLKVTRAGLGAVGLESLPEFAHILSLCDDPKALTLFIGSLLDPLAGRAQYLHLHGGGGNGKSTLFAALRSVLGERHVVTTRADEFMNQHWGDSLEGVRVLLFAEENSTRFFSSGKFKEFTGEEVVTINPKYEKPRRMRLTHKTVVLSNNKVEISASAADRRRLLSISMQDDPDQNVGFRWWYDGLRNNGDKILAYCFGEYLKACEKEPSIRAYIPQAAGATEAAIERKYEDYIEALCDIYEVSTEKKDWISKAEVFERIAEKLGERRTNPVFKQNLSDALTHLGLAEGKTNNGATRVYRGLRKKVGGSRHGIALVDTVSSKVIPAK